MTFGGAAHLQRVLYCVGREYYEGSEAELMRISPAEGDGAAVARLRGWQG